MNFNNNEKSSLYVLASFQNRAILTLSNIIELALGVFTLYTYTMPEVFNSDISTKVLIMFFIFLFFDKILISYTLEYILVYDNKIDEFQFNFLVPRNSIFGEVQLPEEEEPKKTKSLKDKLFSKKEEKEIKIVRANGETISYNVFDS